MRSVEVKSQAQSDIQALHRARERLVSERTVLINHLRSLPLERGIVVPQGRRRLKIAKRLAACLEDPRDPDRVRHERAEMIHYRALLIAAGYPDGNDSKPTPPSRWPWDDCRKAVKICARNRRSAGSRTCRARPRSSA
jgi:hypothetical protein